MKWINVKEEKPTEEGIYAISGEDDKFDIIYWEKEGYFPVGEDDSKEFIPTRWIKLPKVPSEKE